MTVQLDAKDKQINDLTAALASAQVTLTEMQHTQQALTDALTVAQETQKQLSDALAASQALQAGTLQTLREVQQQSQPEPPQDAPVVDAAESEQVPPAEEKSEVQDPPVAEQEQEPRASAMVHEERKKGFWAKLFKK